jgi:GntR family transcriptional regulator
MSKREDMTMPLYAEIQADLMRAIEGGRLPAGCLLPSETQLQETYGVSRATIRKAVEGLAAMGVVIKQQGVGTYVSERIGVGQSVRLQGFLEDILVADARIAFKSIAVEDVTLSDSLQDLFGPEAGAAATRYTSLTLQEGKPIMIGRIYIPLSIAGRIDHLEIRPGEQLTEARLRTFGRSIYRGQQTLSAALADAADARELGVMKGSPLMASRRLYYDRTDLLLAVIDGLYHPENYHIVVDLKPRPDGRFFNL